MGPRIDLLLVEPLNSWIRGKKVRRACWAACWAAVGKGGWRSRLLFKVIIVYLSSRGEVGGALLTEKHQERLRQGWKKAKTRGKSPAGIDLRMKLAHVFLRMITIPNKRMNICVSIDTTVNKGITGKEGKRRGVDTNNDHKACESKTNERAHERGRGWAKTSFGGSKPSIGTSVAPTGICANNRFRVSRSGRGSSSRVYA